MSEIFMEYFVPHGTKYSMMWMNILSHGHGWELLMDDFLDENCYQMKILDERWSWMKFMGQSQTLKLGGKGFGWLILEIY
jgi:hypothetical protein